MSFLTTLSSMSVQTAKCLQRQMYWRMCRRSGGFQVLSQSMVVHFHGDAAVITGIYETKGVDHGKQFVRRSRFVDTWLYKNGVWKSIASLTTPIGS